MSKKFVAETFKKDLSTYLAAYRAVDAAVSLNVHDSSVADFDQVYFIGPYTEDADKILKYVASSLNCMYSSNKRTNLFGKRSYPKISFLQPDDLTKDALLQNEKALIYFIK